MPRYHLLITLTIIACTGLKTVILEDRYFLETKYDLRLLPGTELEFTGFYQFDDDSIGRIYLYELIELRAKSPLRQKFSELNQKWVKVYGFYSGNAIDVKSWTIIKPTIFEIKRITQTSSKNAEDFYRRAKEISELPDGYPLNIGLFKNAHPFLKYIDLHNRYLIYQIKGPVHPPESVASVLHEYISLYLVYERKMAKVNRAVILKEGWSEE
ncbi:MAG: hypothetical protein ABIL05_02245 [candidate division WOR-3 bacterium]